MLTFIAACCLFFGSACAVCVARKVRTQAFIVLVSGGLTACFVALIVQDMNVASRLAEVQREIELQVTLDRSRTLVDQIGSDQRRLAELCAQYPATAGC